MGAERSNEERDRLRSLEHIFEQTEWAVATIHADTHRFELVNPAFARMHGFAVEEMVGRPLEDMCAPESRKEVEERARYAEGQGAYDYESVHVRKDGSRFLARIHVAELKDERERVRSRVVTVQDVTERRRLEADQKSNDDLAAVDRAKDQFIAMLSHELRSPLNVIRLWSQILQRPGRNEEKLREGLEVIDRSSRMQAKLIEDLLDVHRITSGDLRLDLAQVDLAELTRLAVDSMAPLAAEKKLRIDRDLESGVLPIQGDAARLQQVLGNLLGNAIKFTPKEGTIRVALHRIDGRAEVSVTDSGQGILPAELPHLFERFRRAQRSKGPDHGGLGLGLSIAKRLVDLHGGTIAVRSAGTGKGSTFTVFLPLTSAGAVPPILPGRVEADVPVTLEGVLVLVVDDEPDTREAIQRVLEQAGVETVAAGSAEQALDVIRQWPPDVIVSDIGMPGRDGYDFLRTLRALPAARGGRIPAIALTAYVTQEDRDRALRAGFQKHLAKPVESGVLVAAVAALAPNPDPARSPD